MDLAGADLELRRQLAPREVDLLQRRCVSTSLALSRSSLWHRGGKRDREPIGSERDGEDEQHTTDPVSPASAVSRRASGQRSGPRQPASSGEGPLSLLELVAGPAEHLDVWAAFVPKPAVSAVVDAQRPACPTAPTAPAGLQDPEATAQPPQRRAQIDEVQQRVAAAGHQRAWGVSSTSTLAARASSTTATPA